MSYPFKFRLHVLGVREREDLTLLATASRFAVGISTLIVTTPASRMAGGGGGLRDIVGRAGGGARSSTNITIHVDARGASDPAAVEEAANRAVARAVPQIIAASRSPCGFS